MIVLGFALLLYVIAGAMVVIAARRDKALVRKGFMEAWDQFLRILPALTVGVLGAGFVAALVPAEVAQTYLGEGSGVTGYLLAYVIGAVIPGGPVVGFALGAAALQAGASLPIIVVFVTSWGLVNLHRLIIWELATVPRRVTLVRLIVSAPVPIVLGVAASFFV
ncbi:MAG: hypothetical protein AAF590_12565 [Pseudomonadota bacterium]